MIRIPRKSLAVSLAAVLTVGVSSTAFGDGVTDNFSQVSAGINPTLLPGPGENPKAASLYTQVVSIDQDNTPTIPAEAAEVVEIDFPAEMDYTTNSKLDQCAAGTIASLETDGAALACADSIVGSGHAFARIPMFPSTNNEAELTVVAFNGLTSTAGGGFDGGNPTILLHADNAALPGPTVVGEVTTSDGGSDYGRKLNVPAVPPIAGGAGALVQFGAQVARKWTNGKTGQKKKTYNLISADCGGADGDLDFASRWEFEDTTVDTDTYSQNCTPIP